MRTLETWLYEYGESHREPRNRRIHRVCVPLILWSLMGFLSLLRWKGEFLLSAAVATSLASLVFYARLGRQAFLPMLGILAFSLWLCFVTETFVARAWILYAAVFVAAWVGQAVGHFLEGKKPSFFEDLQFLLIGPLWILRKH